ncbi:DUF5344 family protein [Virgibacillus halodenitrificans]|uniref:DUF5344 family protein n=1 Tax=Virgibacillus halodenitrificans TaxID=1482 RepID=UPI002DBDA259|nr:DUF5344 family protein [Virgibacillus halodenitrificans]MEC2159608.1 DUF5344 family protein [Virgibacillus halodenitrificans]
MSEIKIQQDIIDAALTDLKNTTGAFNISFVKEMKGENKLDMIDKIEEINEKINKLQHTYQELLLQNIKKANSAVNSLQLQEQNLASSINSGK